jgi:transposase
MALHGKQMTTEEKQILVALSQQGYSSYKIAEMTGENRRTISKFLRRQRVRGSEENLPRSGRGRKTGVWGDRIMHRMLHSDRRQRLGEITDQFNHQFVTKISSRTVRRRLNFEGYKKHPVCKKTTISPVNREKRKRFCRSKLMWTVRNHWKKVIFSDETKIEIGNNRKVYVWRKVDDRLRPECNGLYQGRNYKTKFSVMFWGCISYYGVGTVTPVVGNLNSEKYINNLDDSLWRVIAQHFPTSPYIFQEDNVPCHVSRRTSQWKTENDIPTLEWPPQSLDLNIIENVWKVIKTKVQRRIDDIRNAENLKTVVAEIWTPLQLHYIRSLYDSLPRRLRVVLRARGNITKY